MHRKAGRGWVRGPTASVPVWPRRNSLRAQVEQIRRFRPVTLALTGSSRQPEHKMRTEESPNLSERTCLITQPKP